MTAAEWFDELHNYPAERVWRAVRRCRRQQSRRPALNELLDAMVANARDQAAESSDHPAIEGRDPDSGGVPAPASVKLALRNLLRKRLPDANEQPVGRSREQQLAELEAIAAEAGEQ